MALQDLDLLDFILIGADTIGLLIVIAYFVNKGTSLLKCMHISIVQKQLMYWRFCLYSSVFSAWIGAIFTFSIPSLIKIAFHIFVDISLGYMFYISLPLYTCKRLGHGGTCACDSYTYTDLIPMAVLGVVGTIVLVIFDFSGVESILMLVPYAILSYIFFKYLPRKEVLPLKYPKELRLLNIDQYQEFIMNNPSEKKLITIVKPTCDFCSMQVDELNQIPEDLLLSRFRIFDLAYKEEIDPILSIYLNIADFSTLPVPSTRIYDGGMEVELKEGIITSIEIQAILFS
ncbi:MAG: hypothetical protein ACXAD7_25165 [Candidatus Kariarchaeaceae archaeon]